MRNPYTMLPTTIGPPIAGTRNTSTQQSGSNLVVTPDLWQQQMYQQLMGYNLSNYNQILNSYGSQMESLGNIYQTVLGGVRDTLGQGGGWGVATPAAQQIAQTYASRRGQTDQQMISSGLNNTTVRQSMQNQNALGEAQAYGGLGAQLANMYAGYQSQLGGQYMGQQAGLTGQLLGQLGGYQFAPPPPQTLTTNVLGWSEGESQGGTQLIRG